jgi:hypothetical protein
MKRVCAITLFIAVFAAVAVSGCAGLFGGQTATPAPTVYGPVPSSLPTPTPTPTPGPAIAHSRSSDDVSIIMAQPDYRAVKDERTYDGRQYENISFLLINDGTQPAKNIKAVVTIINEFTTTTLVYQEFSLGDLAKGEWMQKSLLTDTHDACNYIKITIDISWGEFGEYFNSNPYENTVSFPE